MKYQNILGIPVEFKNKTYILEKILLSAQQQTDFMHIVSLNPEIVVDAQHNMMFKNILSEGDIQLPDGVGILLGCSILGISVQNRIAGVDLMKDVLKTCSKSSLRVLFIGGQTDLAKKIALRYEKLYPSSNFRGIEGFKDISRPTSQEEKEINAIVADYKPQILFAAFGSPRQEEWIYKNRAMLKGVVCMGVGGGFNFIMGTVPRAPKLVRSIGIEWLFRLVIEPWRWKRQLKLITFLYLVFKQRFTSTHA